MDPGDGPRAAPQCAHDELDGILMDHGVEPSQAAVLTRVIAEWAKDQDEWWPWDDGTPDPEPKTDDWSQHPSIKDPDWLTSRLSAALDAQERWRSHFLRDPGNPAAFQATTHRELGHPVDEHTTALAASWTEHTPTPMPWRPSVSIPAGTPLHRHYEVQDWTLWGMRVVLDDRVPRDPGFILLQHPWEDQ